ncbi:MAG: hypothetical protein HYY24_12675 [Verrucomicrobia bacterium]|nr:hypothetical protein [Verrucomicrobiota bacterium]
MSRPDYGRRLPWFGGAAALLVAEKGFRRIQGYHHLAQLIVTLEQHQKSLARWNKAP